jgi:hypothetical protein
VIAAYSLCAALAAQMQDQGHMDRRNLLADFSFNKGFTEGDSYDDCNLHDHAKPDEHDR